MQQSHLTQSSLAGAQLTVLAFSLASCFTRSSNPHVRLVQAQIKMAPISSDDESNRAGASAFDSEEEQVVPVNGTLQVPLEDGEEEFHTEDSDASEADGAEAEDEDAESESESDDIPDGTGVPLLPESLLKHVPQSAPPLQSLADVPWDKLTRKQKRARRNNSRKTKKREYDRLRDETKGTDVIKAGEVAQKKRGVVPAKKDKVVSGRVEKKGGRRAKLSGRQKMVEERKRTIRMAGGGEAGMAAKRVKKSKR